MYIFGELIKYSLWLHISDRPHNGKNRNWTLVSFTRTPFYNHWHEFPLLGNLSRCLNIGWPLYLEAAFIYDVRNNFLSTLNRKKLIARFITVIVNWVREVPWSTGERENLDRFWQQTYFRSYFYAYRMNTYSFIHHKGKGFLDTCSIEMQMLQH